MRIWSQTSRPPELKALAPWVSTSHLSVLGYEATSRWTKCCSATRSPSPTTSPPLVTLGKAQPRSEASQTNLQAQCHFTHENAHIAQNVFFLNVDIYSILCLIVHYYSFVHISMCNLNP